ncbi:MAG TPA: hypothetical protein VNT23_00100 [Gaiellaceae bacterium]|nr:hypothetical protein [Gaiellaceae bacterium]
MLRDLHLGVLTLAAAALLIAGCGGEDEPEARGPAFAVYADDVVGGRADDGSLRCGAPRAACPPNLVQPTGSYRYEPRGEPALGPEAVAEARTTPSEGDWVVSIDLTADGARAFSELTQRLADEGKEAERPRHAAIVVDGEVVAYPEIDYVQYPQGIQTTSLQFFAIDEQDARDLVETVNTATGVGG